MSTVTNENLSATSSQSTVSLEGFVLGAPVSWMPTMVASGPVEEAVSTRKLRKGTTGNKVC